MFSKDEFEGECKQESQNHIVCKGKLGDEKKLSKIDFRMDSNGNIQKNVKGKEKTTDKLEEYAHKHYDLKEKLEGAPKEY